MPDLLSTFWHRLFEWLQRVPIVDPIERRNAPMLQLLLLAFGIVLPIMTALRWSQSWAIVGIDLGGELLMLMRIGFAWICLLLVRAGHFRFAAGLFIGSTLAGLAFGYAVYGLRSQLALQVVHAFPLVLGGLLLGRRALWWIALAMLAIVAAGTARDITLAGALGILRVEAWSNLLGALLGFGGIAIVLDRAVHALRESLHTATRRGRDLAQARDRLEREVVERERSQAQLVHALKMDAIGRAASGIAHDFNNILAVVLGYAGRRVTDVASAETSLAGIGDAARRGALVTRRLLNLGRNEAIAVEDVDVADMLDAVQPLLAQVFDPRVAMTLAIAQRPLPVRLDRSGFELALLNIAGNARDAMPDGGSFEIRARRDDTGAHLLLDLADNGTGMPPDVVAQMFEPFYTTKPRGAGTGIGLSDVRRLVGEAGGEISVDSAPGLGTTLHIRLPLARSARVPSLRSGLRVLLVEDDRAVRASAAATLRDAGSVVVEASSGADAERYAAAAGFDAIVSDFDLGDTCADRLLPRLLARQPRASALLISGHADAHRRCTATGVAAHCLRKPFAPEQLVEALARRLEVA